MNIIQKRAIEKLNANSSSDASYENESRNKYILSPECIFYDIEQVMELTGYSKTIVLKLFNDPALNTIKLGRRKLVEAHELIRYCSNSHGKDIDEYWSN